MNVRGKGVGENGVFPVEESSESASVENREVLKINLLAEYLVSLLRG